MNWTESFSLMIAALVATSLARAGVEIWFLGRPSVKGYVIMSLAGFLAGFLAFVKAMESFLW